MDFLKTTHGADPILVEGLFPASPERLFRAWTTPAELIRWFGGKAGHVSGVELDLRVGGQWRFNVNKDGDAKSTLEGEYTEIDPARRLGFTWCHVTTHPDGRREATGVSRVTLRFEPEGKATRLSLRHEGIATEDGRKGVGGGWDASFHRLVELVAESAAA